MQLPDPKALKKLADTCRKAGIIHFKSPEFEFTLDPDYQLKVDSKKPTVNHGITDQVESDSLSPEELMLWSAPNYGEEIAKDES